MAELGTGLLIQSLIYKALSILTSTKDDLLMQNGLLYGGVRAQKEELGVRVSHTQF